MNTIRLRSAALEVDVDPERGAEVVSVLDRKSGVSVVGSPDMSRTRRLSGDLSADDWERGYRGGWQLLTPNAGDSCVVDGTPHGFHGRASNGRWIAAHVDSYSARLVWVGHGLRVTRQYELGESTLHVETEWASTVDHPVPMIHVEHFALGQDMLSGGVDLRLPKTHADGESIDLQFSNDRPVKTFEVLGPLVAGQAEMIARAAGLTVTLRWDAGQLPYMWLWHEIDAVDGVLGKGARVLGLEPASVGHDRGLAEAIENQQAIWIEPRIPRASHLTLDINSAVRRATSPSPGIAHTRRELGDAQSSRDFGEENVVDSHQHFWDLSQETYPWLSHPAEGGPEEMITQRYAKYETPAYRKEIEPLPVVASVHVEANWNAEDPVGETRWLQAMHDSVGWPSAIVGAVQLESNNAHRLLMKHSQHSAFRGVRAQMGWHDSNPEFQSARSADQMTDPAWRRGLGLLEQLGMSFDLHVYPHQLHDVVDLAHAFQDTSIVLNHCASPGDVGPDRQTWSRGLRYLAECENVSVKLSGIAKAPRSVEEVRDHLSEVVDLFGCHRTMFGSNLPVENLAGSLHNLVDALRLTLSDYSAHERDAVWGGTAARIYRLAPLAELEPNI